MITSPASTDILEEDPSLAATGDVNENTLENFISKLKDCQGGLKKQLYALRDAGLAFETHQALYTTLASRKKHWAILAEGFLLLHRARMQFETHQVLYQALINYPEYAIIFGYCFKTLHKAGMTLERCQVLYQLLIRERDSVGALAQGFNTLHVAGISAHTHHALYQGLANNSADADKLAKGFSTLYEAGMTLEKHSALYQSLVDSGPKANELAKGYKTLYSAMLASGMPSHFLSQMYKHHKLSAYVLRKLTEAGFHFNAHQMIYETFMSRLNATHADYHMVTKILECVHDYANRNSLLDKAHPDYSQQIHDLSEIVEDNTSLYDTLLQGPLNKSNATKLVEVLLDEICDTPIDELTIDFNAEGDYILSLPGKTPVNLSLLIQNANLSQLELNAFLIDKMGSLVQGLLKKEIWNDTSPDPVVNLLPKAQQAAINIYTRQFYVNINKLFRSEPLSRSAEHTFNLDGSKDRLACFLLGCLLNDAARKAHTLIDESPEKRLLVKIAHHFNIEADMPSILVNSARFETLLSDSLACNELTHDESQVLRGKDLTHLYPMSRIYDRGERLNEDVIARRKANPWTLPALTSISAAMEGSPYFHKPGTVRSIIANNPYFGIINPGESEALIPHRECMVTTQGADGLVSMLVRSPSLEPKNHYWSMVALQAAYDNYLSKEYKETPSAITRQGRVIVRPNHDLSHTFRVMQNLEQVIDYFKDYARDPEFKDFCERLTEDGMEWLRVAAAFSITGRESEISAGEDLVRYDGYRAACCLHFNDFVNKTTIDAEPTMQERMTHVVRYMGNPHYESTINDHFDPKEKQLRNFYHRLLTIAHKLDLPRCYGAAQYSHSMQYCRDLSVESVEQKRAFENMIRYNIELIKAHGCHLSCDITPGGELIDASQDYQDNFADASTHLNRLIEFTQSVPKPLRTPSVASSVDTLALIDDELPPCSSRTVYREETVTKRQRFGAQDQATADNHYFKDEVFGRVPRLFFEWPAAACSSGASSHSSRPKRARA